MKKLLTGIIFVVFTIGHVGVVLAAEPIEKADKTPAPTSAAVDTSEADTETVSVDTLPVVHLIVNFEAGKMVMLRPIINDAGQIFGGDVLKNGEILKKKADGTFAVTNKWFHTVKFDGETVLGTMRAKQCDVTIQGEEYSLVHGFNMCSKDICGPNIQIDYEDPIVDFEGDCDKFFTRN